MTSSITATTTKLIERAGGEINERREATLAQPSHSTRVAAMLGIALGISFTVCFLTGVYSHLLQEQPGWWTSFPRPAGLYRVTQGLHVATGIAAIPLLLAKLFAVYPHLFKPLRLEAAHIVERLSIIPLVAGGLFMLFSGLANTNLWYPWKFFFPAAHYWMAWVTIGALFMHVGAKFSLTRGALRRPAIDDATAVTEHPRSKGHASPLSRRQFLGFTGLATGLLTLTTAGQTVPFLRRFTLFTSRRPDPDSDPQGVPVNKTAAQVGATEGAMDPNWQLVIADGDAEAMTLSLEDFEALPLRSATLPIACVEGWSVSADWEGVPIRDLIAMAGIDLDGRDVDVVSVQTRGIYGRSTLHAEVIDDHDTMLALKLNGERLNLDHGFPTRLIAPNRPGVDQTKWVTRLVVR